MKRIVTFSVNGREQALTVEPERALLEVLREDLDLTGTKYGCGEGECGACTVLVDGAPVRSCLRAVASVEGKAVLTIEGLARNGELHPVQGAFLAAGAFQCGYCTPGMILEAVALLAEKPEPPEAEIRSRLEGHICRCSGYPRILEAVRRAAAEKGGRRP